MFSQLAWLMPLSNIQAAYIRVKCLSDPVPLSQSLSDCLRNLSMAMACFSGA